MFKSAIINCRDEAVLGMMSMHIHDKAILAQVVIFARSAVDKFTFGELLNTAVACAC
jgi:hypothetical protein